MFLWVLLAIGLAVAWWLSGKRASSINERTYLKRRGYYSAENSAPDPVVSQDNQLFGLIESLRDVSAQSRERAAQQLARMCESGRRDSRMLSPLVEALDDNDAAVRRAVALALASLSDSAAAAAISRRLEIEESVMVRSTLQKVLTRLSAES
ncbi:MAG TPA: HEAT repeat domain-containing protein [Blastocatellia bacterium]|nr:HEAT repeat domain-containing protein [Blastocatellia bacterium]